MSVGELGIYVEFSLTNYQQMKYKFRNLTIENIWSFAPLGGGKGWD